MPRNNICCVAISWFLTTAFRIILPRKESFVLIRDSLSPFLPFFSHAANKSLSFQSPSHIWTMTNWGRGHGQFSLLLGWWRFVQKKCQSPEKKRKDSSCCRLQNFFSTQKKVVCGANDDDSDLSFPLSNILHSTFFPFLENILWIGTVSDGGSALLPLTTKLRLQIPSTFSYLFFRSWALPKKGPLIVCHFDPLPILKGGDWSCCSLDSPSWPKKNFFRFLRLFPLGWGSLETEMRHSCG